MSADAMTRRMQSEFFDAQSRGDDGFDYQPLGEAARVRILSGAGQDNPLFGSETDLMATDNSLRQEENPLFGTSSDMPSTGLTPPNLTENSSSEVNYYCIQSEKMAFAAQLDTPSSARA